MNDPRWYAAIGQDGQRDEQILAPDHARHDRCLIRAGKRYRSTRFRDHKLWRKSTVGSARLPVIGRETESSVHWWMPSRRLGGSLRVGSPLGSIVIAGRIL